MRAGTVAADQELAKTGTIAMNYGLPVATEYYLMVKVSTQNDGGVLSNRVTDTQERLKIEVQGQLLYDGELLVGFPGVPN